MGIKKIKVSNFKSFNELDVELGNFEDAAKQKQIIITTHNPETIRYVSLEDILLVSRDKDGFSTISKPSKSEQVKNFLQHEIGIAELFAQDLLGV